MKIFNLKVETKKSGNAYYVAYYTINGKQKKFSSGIKYTGKKKYSHITYAMKKKKEIINVLN